MMISPKGKNYSRRRRKMMIRRARGNTTTKMSPFLFLNSIQTLLLWATMACLISHFNRSSFVVEVEGFAAWLVEREVGCWTYLEEGEVIMNNGVVAAKDSRIDGVHLEIIRENGSTVEGDGSDGDEISFASIGETVKIRFFAPTKLQYSDVQFVLEVSGEGKEGAAKFVGSGVGCNGTRVSGKNSRAEATLVLPPSKNEESSFDRIEVIGGWATGHEAVTLTPKLILQREGTTSTAASTSTETTTTTLEGGGTVVAPQNEKTAEKVSSTTVVDKHDPTIEVGTQVKKVSTTATENSEHTNSLSVEATKKVQDAILDTSSTTSAATGARPATTTTKGETTKTNDKITARQRIQQELEEHALDLEGDMPHENDHNLDKLLDKLHVLTKKKTKKETGERSDTEDTQQARDSLSTKKRHRHPYHDEYNPNDSYKSTALVGFATKLWNLPKQYHHDDFNSHLFGGDGNFSIKSFVQASTFLFICIVIVVVMACRSANAPHRGNHELKGI